MFAFTIATAMAVAAQMDHAPMTVEERYVLDAQGLIREKNVRGEALGKAIEALLEGP